MKTLGLVFSLFAFSSDATIAVIHDIKTMTKNSNIVIQAKIIQQKVMKDDKGRIITLTTLEVEDGMKGAKTGQKLTLYQVGGELNGRVMRLQGSSVYQPGEEVILFALPFKDKIVSYGLGLGKFNITKQKAEYQVIEDIQGLDILQKREGREFYTEPSPRKYRSLKDFKNEIRKAL